jgi:predicted nucleic acid-binding protein
MEGWVSRESVISCRVNTGARLLDALIAVSKPVYRSLFWRPLLRDTDDDMVLEAALSGLADLLVTYNLRVQQ